MRKLTSLLNLTFFATFFWGCQSTSTSGSEQKNLDLHLTDTKDTVEKMAKLESDFWNGKCESSKATLSDASILNKIPLSQWTPGARLAYLMCQALPTDSKPDQIKQALEALNQHLSNPTPILNEYYLHSMRAKFHTALKQDKAAESAFKDALRVKPGNQDSTSLSPTESLKAVLEPIVPKIPSSQLLKFREFLETVDDKSIPPSAHMALVEQILPKLKGTPEFFTLKNVRKQLLIRQEANFLQDLDDLESRLSSTKASSESSKMAIQSLRERFPEAHFDLRIRRRFLGNNPELKSNVASSGLLTPTSELVPNTKSNVALPTPFTNAAANPALSPASNVSSTALTSETAITQARAQMDSGNPLKGVEILDSLTPDQKTEQVKRLRLEAAEIHIRQQRIKVRDLYNRSKTLKELSERINLLAQCKEILEGILKTFPTHSGKSNVERNLRLITLELNEIKKGS